MVAVASVAKWCPSAEMYDFLPLLWSRSGANAKIYELWLLLWCRSGAPMLRYKICCRCFRLEVVPMLRCTICCRCFGLEVVVPQCQKGRFVAVALVMKWCPSVPLLRFVAVALAAKFCLSAKKYDVLPLLWSGSGDTVPGCTICCCWFGFEVLPQCQDVRLFVVALFSKWCPSNKMFDLMLFLVSKWS